MKKVMVRAWEIAREGVKRFGGKVKEYFAEALKLAWKEVKRNAVTEKQRNYLNALIENFDEESFVHNHPCDRDTAIDVVKYMKKVAKEADKKEASECIKFFQRAQKKKESKKQSKPRFITAKYAGFDAETGERFSAGATIFYCKVNGGYCLADNF